MPRPRPRPMTCLQRSRPRPRPRTSKNDLEDPGGQWHVLNDSITGNIIPWTKSHHSKRSWIHDLLRALITSNKIHSEHTNQWTVEDKNKTTKHRLQHRLLRSHTRQHHSWHSHIDFQRSRADKNSCSQSPYQHMMHCWSTDQAHRNCWCYPHLPVTQQILTLLTVHNCSTSRQKSRFW